MPVEVSTNGVVVEAVGIDISKCSMRWYDRPVGLSDIADVGDHTVSSDRSLSTDTFGPPPLCSRAWSVPIA